MDRSLFAAISGAAWPYPGVTRRYPALTSHTAALEKPRLASPICITPSAFRNPRPNADIRYADSIGGKRKGGVARSEKRGGGGRACFSIRHPGKPESSRPALSVMPAQARIQQPLDIRHAGAGRHPGGGPWFDRLTTNGRFTGVGPSPRPAWGIMKQDRTGSSIGRRV